MGNKILLLEDDVALAETLQDLLEEDGYSVDVVLRADAAIEATYAQHYDLYIFDINVPDMTGLELLKSLRHAEDTTPTIFISALVDLNSISEAFAIGAQDYLKKPFLPQELLIRVNAKLQQQNNEAILYKDFRYLPAKKLLYKGDALIAMGEVQECLCDIFFHNIGQVLDKVILMDCLLHPSESALRVALNKFKQTTGIAIKNIRGVGYMIEKS